MKIICEQCCKEFNGRKGTKYCLECRELVRKEQARQRAKQWYSDKDNQVHKNKLRRLNQKKRIVEDANYRFKRNMLKAMTDHLINRGGKHNGNTKYLKYVDYTINELRQHIQSKFTHDMNWDNYGILWSLDHIRPQSSFVFIEDDVEQLESIKECWRLDNLQPMYILDNIHKGSKYAGEIWSKGERVN